MRAFWDAMENLDRAVVATMDRTDQLLGRASYRKRIEKAVAHVRTPQKAIRFDDGPPD